MKQNLKIFICIYVVLFFTGCVSTSLMKKPHKLTSNKTVYESCMEIKIKEFKAKGEKYPRFAAHYFCVIIEGVCKDEPQSDACKKVLQDLINN